MTSKVQHIAVLIDVNRDQANHWFELFQQLRQYLKSDIQFIIWDNEIADIARSIVDIDTVHLMSSSIFKLNDYKAINLLFQKYSIEKCIEIGNIPKFVNWKLKQNPIIKRIIILDKFQKLDYSDYILRIYPDNTGRVNYRKGIAYTPFPQVNYKNFLDLNTQTVLDIKQNIGLLSYNNQIINKSFVCGYVGGLSRDLIRYLEYNNCEWYDVTEQKGSFILPNNFRNNLPIVYELLDCLIITGDINDITNYHILNAMASGTIIIVPREEEYQILLGKGALYYSPDSSSELTACIDVIQKNENKKLTIRDFASEQFQRKYSYQAIAQFFSKLLIKI